MRPVLLAVLLALALPATAAATSRLVIADAEAFWAPYNGGVPPCGTGLRIDHFGGDDPNGRRFNRDMALATPGTGGCVISVNLDYWSNVEDRNRCTIIAHEIGHAYFGLEHSDDPTNVMAPNYWVTHSVPTCSHLSRWLKVPGATVLK